MRIYAGARLRRFGRPLRNEAVGYCQSARSTGRRRDTKHERLRGEQDTCGAGPAAVWAGEEHKQNHRENIPFPERLYPDCFVYPIAQAASHPGLNRKNRIDGKRRHCRKEFRNTERFAMPAALYPHQRALPVCRMGWLHNSKKTGSAEIPAEPILTIGIPMVL